MDIKIQNTRKIYCIFQTEIYRYNQLNIYQKLNDYLPGFKTDMAALTALNTKLSRANIQWGLILCNRNTALT